jgi:hypothetical protein
MEQLKSEYNDLTSPNERIKNLEEQHLVSKAKLELEKSNSAQVMKAMQQITEQNCQEQHVPINSSLQMAAGIDVTRGNANDVIVPKRDFFHSDPITKSTDRKLLAANSDPIINLGSGDAQIKR